jgi:hypothetical protein
VARSRPWKASWHSCSRTKSTCERGWQGHVHTSAVTASVCE